MYLEVVFTQEFWHRRFGAIGGTHVSALPRRPRYYRRDDEMAELGGDGWTTNI